MLNVHVERDTSAPPEVILDTLRDPSPERRGEIWSAGVRMPSGRRLEVPHLPCDQPLARGPGAIRVGGLRPVKARPSSPSPSISSSGTLNRRPGSAARVPRARPVAVSSCTPRAIAPREGQAIRDRLRLETSRRRCACCSQPPRRSARHHPGSGGPTRAPPVSPRQRAAPQSTPGPATKRPRATPPTPPQAHPHLNDP